MAGNATLTIVPSRNAADDPRMQASSVRRCARVYGASGARVGLAMSADICLTVRGEISFPDRARGWATEKPQGGGGLGCSPAGADHPCDDQRPGGRLALGAAADRCPDPAGGAGGCPGAPAGADPEVAEARISVTGRLQLSAELRARNQVQYLQPR